MIKERELKKKRNRYALFGSKLPFWRDMRFEKSICINIKLMRHILFFQFQNLKLFSKMNLRIFVYLMLKQMKAKRFSHKAQLL